MAIYCPQCGKELPEDAIFCMKCGKPLTAASQAVAPPATQWEYCDIEEFLVKDSTLFSNSIYALRAAAVSPARGHYEAKQSDSYNIESGSSKKAWVRDDLRRQDALDKLIKALATEGWELLPNKGKNWWSHKFRRRVS